MGSLNSPQGSVRAESSYKVVRPRVSRQLKPMVGFSRVSGVWLIAGRSLPEGSAKTAFRRTCTFCCQFQEQCSPRWCTLVHSSSSRFLVVARFNQSVADTSAQLARPHSGKIAIVSQFEVGDPLLGELGSWAPSLQDLRERQ